MRKWHKMLERKDSYLLKQESSLTHRFKYNKKLHTSKHLSVSLSQLEPQGAAGGLVLGGTRCWGYGEQDGAPLPAKWFSLAAVWFSIAAVTFSLGLCFTMFMHFG